MVAFRDPAVVCSNGVFHAHFNLPRKEEEGAFWCLGYSRSIDLREWAEPRPLTPRNRELNSSSPRNVIRFRIAG
jgi:hypothetical protein